jgi:hypothetical protein
MPRGRSKQAYGNRTDLNAKIPKAAPTGMPYGENKTLMDRQSAVAMGNPEMAISQTDTPATLQDAVSTQPSVTPIPLTEPTQRPNENILTGATTTRQPNQDIQTLKSLQPLFEAEASQEDAPQIFREFVSWLQTQ